VLILQAVAASDSLVPDVFLKERGHSVRVDIGHWLTVSATLFVLAPAATWTKSIVSATFKTDLNKANVAKPIYPRGNLSGC